MASRKALDFALHLAHLGLIVFTLVGWMFCETRLVHITMMALIGASWVGLGYIHGFGYCLLTDIQWKLKAQMGEEVPASGYMKYLADRLTGRDLNAKSVDIVTYSAGALCAAASLMLTLTAGAC